MPQALCHALAPARTARTPSPRASGCPTLLHVEDESVKGHRAAPQPSLPPETNTPRTCCIYFGGVRLRESDAAQTVGGWHPPRTCVYHR